MELAEAVVTALVEQTISAMSGHKKSFPGEDLIPSQITCVLGNNILHVAAKHRGSSDVIDILESHPLLAHETNAKGDTPLLVAARLGKLDVVKGLVEDDKKRLKVEAENLLRKKNNEGNTALLETVMNGHSYTAELPIKEDPTLTTFDNEAGGIAPVPRSGWRIPENCSPYFRHFS